MLYDVLRKYRSYLEEKYSKETARTYYIRLCNLFEGQDIFGNGSNLNIEKVLNNLANIEHKNHFSQCKNALLHYCEFMNISLPVDVLNDIKELENKYASWEWRLGRKLPFTAEYSKRFLWGDLTLQFCVEGGVIRDAIAYSDGMETDYIKAIGDTLKGVLFSSGEINRTLTDLANRTPIDEAMLSDILEYVKENNF